MNKLNNFIDIVDWVGYYKIDENGNIFSIRNNRLIKPCIRGQYLSVILSKNGYKKKYNVHRLVAFCFLKNPLNKPCVNHIDGNKINNHYTNLEWVTYSENERHSHYVLGKKIIHSEETKNKIRAKSIGRDMSAIIKKSAEKRRGLPAKNRVSITRINKDGSEKRYPCLLEAAKDVGGVITAFYLLKIGRLKTYKSYKWKFEN